MSLSSVSASCVEATPSILTGSTLLPTVTTVAPSVTVSIVSSPTTTSTQSVLLTTSVSVEERDHKRRAHKHKPIYKPFRKLWNDHERDKFDGLNKDLSMAVAKTDRKQAADVLKRFSERNKHIENAKDAHEVTGMAKDCIVEATTSAEGTDPSWAKYCECVLSIKDTYDQFVGKESAAGKTDVLAGWRNGFVAAGMLYVAAHAC
jgi:hypothetical protein